MKSFFGELKRRRVYSVAVAYVVVAWLLIQVATQVFPFFDIPNWVVQLVVLLAIVGFPVSLVCAWAFELTPEGIKREGEIERRIPRKTGRKLTGVIVIVAALAAGVTVFRYLQSEEGGEPAEPPPLAVAIASKSIAVLPFENLSEEKANAFFAEGMQGEILTHLAQIADLKVISRTSVMPYKSGAPRNLREIGQQLDVAHVVEGRVQRAANKVRVVVRLIDARNEAHLWAQTYDRDLADVFAIQSEIAKAVAEQLQARLSPREKAALEQKPTDDLAAYDFYVRGKALADLGTPTFDTRVRRNLLEAASLLEQAIARDPSFFLAYYHLAEVHDRLYFFGSDHTPARLALGDNAVAAAQRLRPDSAETHLMVGRHLYLGYRDYERARKELALAARALPNDPWAVAYIGFMDRRQGRWEEHVQNLNRALALDPRNLFMLQELSVSYLLLRRYPEMAALLDRIIALAPEDPALRVARASIEFLSRGDTRPLHTAIDAILAQNPSAARPIAIQWLTLALCERDFAAAARAVANIPADGISIENTWFPHSWFEAIAARARGDSAAAQARFTAAREQIERLMRDQPEYGEPLCVLGMIDAGLGRKVEAIQAGRRGVELVPEAKDAMNGVNARRHLAMIYAWVGEKEAALEELSAVTKRPGYLSYGRLKLHPEWDPLRGDPRFDEIVNSLAQK